MTATDLNRFGDELVTNSARWFPALHERRLDATTHFALGLAGEIGELVASDDTAAGLDPSELADVATYALELGRSAGVDLQVVDQFDDLPADPLIALVHAGLAAVEVVKKVHRGDAFDDALQARLGAAVVATYVLCDVLSAGITGERIEWLIAAKQQVCEERWGSNDG